MGTLSCQRCGAKAEGATQKEADDKIDHAVGKMRGRPCSGKESDLVWTGSKAPKVEKLETVTETKSPKKSKKKSKKG